jgi:putative alpha-1,2-mannosidase
MARNSRWLIEVIGDKWAYSFDVVHDVPGLIERRGGSVKFVQSLDDHFDGGHNDHSNEVIFILASLIHFYRDAYRSEC